MSDPSKYSTYSHIRAIKEVYNKCMHLQNVVPAIVVQNNRYRYSFIKKILKKSIFQFPNGIIFFFRQQLIEHYYDRKEKLCTNCDLKSFLPKSVLGITSGWVSVSSLGPLPSMPYPHTKTSPAIIHTN